MADNNFETSLKSLEEIVAKLESGNCSLEESISLFEKGMKLSSECTVILEKARQRIRTLADLEGAEENA